MAQLQRRIKPDELAGFLKNNIEPLSDQIYGNRYRAAARLTDDTYLPCVVFQGRKSQVELALRRFDQLRKQHGCESVEYSVELNEGQVKLKAKAKT